MFNDFRNNQDLNELKSRLRTKGRIFGKNSALKICWNFNGALINRYFTLAFKYLVPMVQMSHYAISDTAKFSIFSLVKTSFIALVPGRKRTGGHVSLL